MTVEDQEEVIDETAEDDADEVQEDEIPEQEESEEPETDEEEDEDDDDDDDIHVSFGDEEDSEPPQREEAPKWVKEVRKSNRKLQSEVKRLKRELEQRSTAAKEPPPIEVGEKPTLKSVKYDDKAYEKALADWYDRKRQADEQEAARKRAEEAQQKVWQDKQQRYAKLKSEHGFRGYEEAEEFVGNTLDVTQQGIIIHAAKDPAKMIFALGTRHDKLEELAKITDPVEFATEIGRLEGRGFNVGTSKKPAPEKRVKGGTAAGGGNLDAQLEKAREKAAKTGDYTEVRKLRAKIRERKNKD